jgi:2-amino-4-hydroxy-6-hydroxymethyldihydropteridine diphosphokinase
MPVTTHIALGSNLGDRRENILSALAALREHTPIGRLRASSFYETAPVGGPAGQGAYLNAVAEFETTLAPENLLHFLLEVETRHGRVRTVRDAPRTLDLDILLYDSLVVQGPELTVPHPRMHKRAFVLVPLAEIAPGALHPVLGKSVATLLAELQGIRPARPSPGRELFGLRTLVTGSSSGIGAAIALAFADAGANVIVHGRSSAAAAEDVARRVRLRGGEATILMADLRDPAGCDRFASEALSARGGLDVFVNNAGVDTLTGVAAGWSFERKMQELLAVDVQAGVTLARTIGQSMKAAGGGVILNMGWDQGETGMEGDSGELFALVKGAMMAFSRSLALSLAPEVRVNCLAPGWVRTAWGEAASAEWQERVIRETPLRRWGTPEDVAAVARWAASPAAAFVTGQVLRVNGGAVR